MSWSIANHKRLKPKKAPTFGTKKSVIKKKSNTSKEDKSYLKWFSNQDIPCFVCGTLLNVDGHHIKRDSTSRKDHTKLLPLCKYHHTALDSTLSPHTTSKLWRDTYSMKAQEVAALKIYLRFKNDNS